MKRVAPEKASCCGCGACANVCPKRAIAMQPDGEGFVYPVVDDALCVDCGLCVTACSIEKTREPSTFAQGYAAAQHNDADVVNVSSSGGLFSALCEQVLAQHGVIYGVRFDEAFRVCHARAETAEEAARFRGSKYVQSDVGDAMSQAASDLKDGRLVLFSGTPCQIDGLRCFLEAKHIATENLITCDFVCHGVSSPRVWSDYTAFLAEQNGSLDAFNFRGKENGWHKYYPFIEAGGQNVSKQYKEKNSYFRMYCSSVITRPSCYQCRYTSYERVSDLSLADFWNIDKAAPEMNDDRGTSQVLINTAKGQEWFDRCGAAVRSKTCTKEDVWQPHLEYPTKAPKARAAFWTAYGDLPFAQVIRRYGHYPFTTKCRHAVMPVINKLGLYTLAGKLYKLVFVRNKKQ